MRHLAEEIGIGDTLGWPSPMDRSLRLTEGYLPLLELVIEGLESFMPQDESERRHDLYALA